MNANQLVVAENLKDTFVLLVEDDESDVQIFRRIVLVSNTSAQFGATIRIALAENLKKAEEILKKGDIDLIMLDLFLSDAKFLESLEYLVKVFPATPVIVYSGLYDRELAIKAIEAGAKDYIVKQHMSEQDLVPRILHAIKRHSIIQQLKKLVAEYSVVQ